MGIWQFDTITLLVGVSLILGFHILWFVTSLKYNAFLMPALGFLLASPISLAGFFPHFELFKLVRIYCTIVMICFGFVYIYKQQRFGRASTAFVLFMAYFFIGAFYSTEPFPAMLFKGAFVLAGASGILWGLRVASAGDYLSFTRQMFFYSILFCLLVLSGLIFNPSLGTRLSVWGMNANNIAGAAALSMTLIAYIALYDPSKRLRIVATVLFFITLIILLATGSRGGLAKAIFGVLLVVAPILKSPRTVITITLTATFGMYITLNYFLPEASERMLSVENSRVMAWTDAWEIVEQDPLFGVGWAHYFNGATYQPTNAHSVPLQIMSDIGIVGLSVTILLFVVIFKVCVDTFFLFSRNGLAKGPLCLAMALFGAVMVQGMAEAGAMFGSTIDPFYWGLGIGLVDALHRIAQNEQAEVAGYAYGGQWDGGNYQLAQ